MYETLETLPSLEGYRFSYSFRYPKPVIFIAYLAPFLFAVVFYILWKFVRHNLFVGAEGPAISWIVILTWFAAVALRALIQRGISRLLGYSTSFGITHITFPIETYTTDPGQFQKRSHALFIAMTPLVLLILLWLPLLAGLQGVIGDILGFYLFMSMGQIVGDIYFIWQLFQMPKRALLYRVNPKESLVFEPTS